MLYFLNGKISGMNSPKHKGKWLYSRLIIIRDYFLAERFHTPGNGLISKKLQEIMLKRTFNTQEQEPTESEKQILSREAQASPRVETLNNFRKVSPAFKKFEITPPKRKNPMFFWVFIASASIMTIMLLLSVLSRATGGGLGFLTPNKQNGIFGTVKNFIFKPDMVLSGQEHDRINILLLGIGGSGHDGPYLSDTNIIASIKPSTHEVALISIPRDLGVKINGHGVRKINNADAFGEAQQQGNGGEYARQIFEHTFNLNIPYYIRVDFAAFEELIDQLGGITVNVPNSFTDYSFPLGETTAYTTVHFDAGVQMMDGETALNYARSRHGNNGEASDFARSRRQQLVLEAIKSKMLSLGTYADPGRLAEMYSSLTSHVTTNMNIAELAYLASLAKDYNQIKTLVLDNSSGGYLISTTGDSGAFLLLPKDGSFDSINYSIKNIFAATSTGVIASTAQSLRTNLTTNNQNTSSGTHSSAKIQIENGTWIPGLAARTQKKLIDSGYRVLSIGNSLERPIANTMVFLLNSSTDKNTISSLLKLINASNVTVTSTLPDWLKDEYDDPDTPENEAGMKYNQEDDILVILGADVKE